MVKKIQNSMEVHKVQRDFWSHCLSRWPVSLGLSRGYAKSRFRRWIAESDLRITLFLMEDRVWLYVTGNGEEADEDVFLRIRKYRELLNDALAGSTFIPGDNPRCTTEYEGNICDRNNWNVMADWLLEQEKKYEDVLRGGCSWHRITSADPRDTWSAPRVSQMPADLRPSSAEGYSHLAETQR